MKVTVKSFGSYENVQFSEIFVSNDCGSTISFSDLGARINSWSVPTKSGKKQMILGHAEASEVFQSSYCYGATIGPVAGRIDGGRFTLEGKNFQLSQNEGNNHLHGGESRYDLQKFEFSIEEKNDCITVVFTLDDIKNTEYPAGIFLEIRHTFDNENRWTVEYKAKSSGTTIFNPTNHVYFNLNGNNEFPITNHMLRVEADSYFPVRDDGVPTGEIVSVDGTVFDLQKNSSLEVLPSSKLSQKKGYDHPFLLGDGGKFKENCITLSNELAILNVSTTSSTVVLYTHNFVTEQFQTWRHPNVPYSGIAIETQEAPDCIHHPEWGNIILHPDDTFHAKTEYRLELK